MISAREDRKGLANVRIGLEDGRYALTDQDGNWHLDDIRPGTHVVQLDLDSLAEGYELLPCADNTRFAGRTYSQFVNVRGGSLWRADFYVKKAGADQTNAQPLSTPAAAPASPRSTPATRRTQLVELLPYDDKWLATAEPGVEWLHPQDEFQSVDSRDQGRGEARSGACRSSST